MGDEVDVRWHWTYCSGAPDDEHVPDGWERLTDWKVIGAVPVFMGPTGYTLGEISGHAWEPMGVWRCRIVPEGQADAYKRASAFSRIGERVSLTRQAIAESRSPALKLVRSEDVGPAPDDEDDLRPAIVNILAAIWMVAGVLFVVLPWLYGMCVIATGTVACEWTNL